MKLGFARRPLLSLFPFPLPARAESLPYSLLLLPAGEFDHAVPDALAPPVGAPVRLPFVPLALCADEPSAHRVYWPARWRWSQAHPFASGANRHGGQTWVIEY